MSKNKRELTDATVTLVDDFQGWDDRIEKRHVEWFVWTLALDATLRKRFDAQIDMVRKNFLLSQDLATSPS